MDPVPEPETKGLMLTPSEVREQLREKGFPFTVRTVRLMLHPTHPDGIKATLVLRKDGGHRYFVAEEEVEAWLARHGGAS